MSTSELAISWDSLDQPEDQSLAKALLRFVRTRGGASAGLPADERLSVRKTWLPFYPDLGFVEITDGSDPKRKRQLYALLDPEKDEATIINLTNGPVYAVNQAGRLQLKSDKDAVRYVVFFFSCVAGPYGLMPVVETLATPEADTAVDEETAAVLAKLCEGPNRVIPPRAVKDGSNWRVFAALLFQGSVFSVEVVIDPKGFVKVDKHELALAAGQPDEGESAEPKL